MAEYGMLCPTKDAAQASYGEWVATVPELAGHPPLVEQGIGGWIWYVNTEEAS